MLTSIHELAEGGRGLKLMWQIADELSYARTTDGRNCLCMSKTYEAEGFARSKNIRKASASNGLMKLLNRWDWLDAAEQEAELDDSPVKKISLEVNTEVNALTQVLDWFEQLRDLSIPDEVRWGCQLALAEGFTNAVRHAHKHLPSETPIQLEILVFEGRLEIRIWDCGKPFDFHAKLKEVTGADRKTRAVSEDLSEACVVQSLPKTFRDACFSLAG